MNIVVAVKHIPSIADDLPVKGNNVDFDSVDFVLNFFDVQSIEQAVLIKEAVGGTITVIGVDLIGELDGSLHLALAMGADKAVKITADDPAADSHQQAKWLSEAIKGRRRSARSSQAGSARSMKPRFRWWSACKPRPSRRVMRPSAR